MKNTINFEKAFLEQQSHRRTGKKSANLNSAILGLLLCVAVIGAAAAYMKYIQYISERDFDANQSFLSTSPQVLECARLQEIQDEYRSLAAYNDGVETMADIIQQRPLFTVQVYTVLQDSIVEGMILQSLSCRSDGILQASFTCRNASDAASYVEAVRGTKFFEAVSYNGWKTDEECSFQINCMLKGSEES